MIVELERVKMKRKMTVGGGDHLQNKRKLVEE